MFRALLTTNTSCHGLKIYRRGASTRAPKPGMLTFRNTESSVGRALAQDVHGFFFPLSFFPGSQTATERDKVRKAQRAFVSAVEELHERARIHARAQANICLAQSLCTPVVYQRMPPPRARGLTFGPGSTKDGALMFISLW